MLLSVLVATLIGAQSTPYKPASQLCLLDSPDINESSGLAESFQFRNVFYTHNDSGDTARFFRFNQEGEVTGVFNLPNIKANDWEDMATAKHGGRFYLYFGDIGDNAEKRSSVLVHRIEEPSNKAKSGDVKQILTYEFTYPDSAHNCEALMVDSNSSMIYIVTKNASGKSDIFSIKAPKKSGKYKLFKCGILTFSSKKLGGNLVTGGAFSSDGKKAVIRTYSDIFEYTINNGVDRWFMGQPLIWSAPAENQGEAIAYRNGSSALITSSEGLPCPINHQEKN